MNRQLTALFAAFEALLVLAIGVAIPLAPLTLLWGVQYGFALDWAAFWRASVDIWLLGHGVDITLALDPATAAALGLPGAGAPVTLTIAALGFALLTVLLGVRAGRRVAETRFRTLGEIVSLAAFALGSFAVTWSALYPIARPSLWQGTLLPTLVFGAGLLIGTRIGHPDARPGRLRAWLAARPPQLAAALTSALRGGTAAAALVVALAAVLTTVAIVINYARIITLYESLHTEVLGGVVITLGQLAFLPNLVIWTASWLIGPGFAIGTGSTVSPLATTLGPLPAIPLLGALPSGESAFGYVGLLVPVVAGFLIGAVLAPRLRRELDGIPLVAVGVGVGLIGGVILGLLAWFSAGAAGPGRLHDVGPNPWAVGVVAAVELGIAATLGMYASLRLPARDRMPARR